jgi:hypothetical protein
VRPKPKPQPAPKPVVIRRLPTRDPPIVRVDDTLRVLGATELVRSRDRADERVVSLPTAIFGVWFALGAAMLLFAGAVPLLAATSALGASLAFRRGQIALVGIYMLIGPAVGYLVVVATS